MGFFYKRGVCWLIDYCDGLRAEDTAVTRRMAYVCVFGERREESEDGGKKQKYRESSPCRKEIYLLVPLSDDILVCIFHFFCVI